MSEEVENQEAPNWLSELEKKREKRVKARLGHEAGAGAPCIKCESKCPGLDLHFWRKICKNCKCSKEDHDVHDDDIYGWAQFELTGSRPTRIKKKIVLPGKKDEVELDWAPKGNTETIDRYLKTLSPESLPVKGSQAAQARKQLLQKQIPIHDIDPSLCHELTDSELAKMQDYIKHMKSSAGVGQVIQFGLNFGNLHTMNEANAKFIANRYPKGIPSIETVQLFGENKSAALTKHFDKLGIKDQKELDAFFDKIPNPHNMAAYSEKLGYIPQQALPDPPNYTKIDQNTLPANYNYADSQNLSNSGVSFAGNLESQKLGYVRGNAIPVPGDREINRNASGDASHFARENILNDLSAGYAEDLLKSEPNYAQQTVLANHDGRIAAEINRNAVNLPHYTPGKFNIHSDQQNPVKIGDILNHPSSSYAQQTALANQDARIGAEINRNLPHYIPGKFNIHSDQQNPAKIGDIINHPSSGYAEDLPNYARQTALANQDAEINRNAPNLPHYTPGKFNIHSDQQNPAEIGHNLNHPSLGYAEDLPNYAQQTALANQDAPIGAEINRNLPHYAPGKFNIHSDQQNPDKIGNLRDLAFTTQNVDVANSNYKGLPAFNANQYKVPEDQLVPNRVNIGAIQDITYNNPEIKSAIQSENKFFDGNFEVGRTVPEDFDIQTKHCRKCSKQFKPDEFAIFVEKSDSLYHSDCFKCAGCNQSLADLFYFYDKESDSIYCGRDFAKIRGIPRCKACDELIFVKEYCLAENSTFHLKHFCCFECDQALAGQNYVVEDSQPVCLPCYEKVKANKCIGCSRVIGPDEEGVALAEGLHFHFTDDCFSCKRCKKPLRGAKLLFRNNKLYCSHDCYRSDQ